MRYLGREGERVHGRAFAKAHWTLLPNRPSMRQRIRFDYVSKDRMYMQKRFTARAPMLAICDVTGRVALGVWCGALIGFAFIFAPALFGTLENLSEAGTIVGKSLASLTRLGYVAGSLALVCAALSLPGRREVVRIALIAVMLALGWYGSSVIIPHMNAIAASASGAVGQLPKHDERRKAWDREHSRSVAVYGVQMLLGLGALSLAGRRRPD